MLCRGVFPLGPTPRNTRNVRNTNNTRNVRALYTHGSCLCLSFSSLCSLFGDNPRTNLDCDLLEAFLTEVGGGQRFGGARDSGKENAFSCCVLAGMRSQVDRRVSCHYFVVEIVYVLLEQKQSMFYSARFLCMYLRPVLSRWMHIFMDEERELNLSLLYSK